tara:strand:+ start:1115 stop:1714 length:600 start_codon:yes stop_codon:yes gene_type:complete
MEITIDVDGPDGLPDNPGEVVWLKPVRTDMKANQNFNLGLSATLSIPLNRKLVKQCHDAAQTQIDMQTQMIANKRLDFEIARLKNCGELKQSGIMFHPKSQYASICSDVIITNSKGLPDHTHKLNSTSSSFSSKQEEHDSSPSDSNVSDSQKEQGQFFQRIFSLFQRPSSQEVLQSSEADQLGVWQVGQMKLQPQQSSQ